MLSTTLHNATAPRRKSVLPDLQITDGSFMGGRDVFDFIFDSGLTAVVSVSFGILTGASAGIFSIFGIVTVFGEAVLIVVFGDKLSDFFISTGFICFELFISFSLFKIIFVCR
jgi:hypothetical protein